MSNEALEENTEEVDVMSLLAEQGEKADEEIVDDDDSPMPETVEELQAALEREREIKRKRNHSLRQSKKAQKRTDQENEALLARLAKVEDGLNQGQSKIEAESLDRTLQDLKMQVEDDPTSVVDIMQTMNKGLIADIRDYFSSIKEENEARFAKLENVTNPENIEYAKEIEALRSMEAYKDLSYSALVAMAKDLKKVAQKASRGTIGGKRAAKSAPKKPKVSSDELSKMGFGK